MHKVLIANRGEIAVRIARACNERGIDSVAVYADVDADAFHVISATEAYALQGNSPADTYLNVPKLLEIARRSGADAVHPGYGFLSENADFAELVQEAGLVWIGPSPETIRLLGNKVTAREVALAVGAPLAAGSDGPVASAEEVREFALQHGLPVAIKAAYGGGGRGLKVVSELDGIEEAFDSAVRESMAAFGRDECFVEQFLTRPRHVEAQVLADTHGNVVVVGTRDCSLQRRHQKLVEEAPAPFLTDDVLEQIYTSAKAICRQAGYTSAGTVEYLVTEDGTVSFLEVNTRLQVEHPITEETSGIDLVQAQLAIAAGERLELKENPRPGGHAFEFRINAEDPGRGFLPSPGTLDIFEPPTGPGIRVDTGFRAGDVIPGQFDSLVAKLIVTGADREEALRRARRALTEFKIGGIATVLPFHQAVVNDPAFTKTDAFGVYTNWIETAFTGAIPANTEFSTSSTIPARHKFSIEVDGRRVELGLPAGLLAASGTNTVSAARLGDGSDASIKEEPAATLVSTMAGTVLKWLVSSGDEVAVGDPVLVLEAMKMEATVAAHRSGTLGKLFVDVGSTVTQGMSLAAIS